MKAGPDQAAAAELAALRERIDALDLEILERLAARARLAVEVARAKARRGDADFYRPEREAQVLRRLLERNPGPLEGEAVARIFREIMSACLALEQPITVAFLGPEGTYTQEAVIKHFGHAVRTRPMVAIDEVFREVEAGAANYGVVPVENSSEGVVNHTLDGFIESSLKICGEVELPIHLNFLVGPRTDPQAISRVYAHPQALAQCRKWLDANYPGIERIPVSSNGEAARRVKGEWNSAAIAGEMAMELYGLVRLWARIEDRPDNSTRFLVIGREVLPPSGDDKTSILVATRNEPGALYAILEPLRDHGIDMTRIETRPSPSGKWNYLFFIDFKGHVDEPPVRAALDEVRRRALDLKFLGSYPRAVL
ncbi:MAG: chorismate mutase [Porticoccaceae bacterium]|nr:MAG: chorismate mutase [Porticoccaceae bacterium]